MTTLLFSLRGVPEDEAFEVRALLNEHAIDFYETSAGNWGISMPALWVKSSDDLAKAQMLLAQYQQQRYLTQRALYLQRKVSGEKQPLFKKTLQFVATIAAITTIIYISIKWLFELGLSVK